MGSGKTLLLNILNKNNRKYNGTILFEGKDLKKINNKTYSSDISIVHQIQKRPFFTTSQQYLYKNIRKNNSKDKANKILNSIVKAMSLKFLLNIKVRDLTPSQFRWIDLASKIASYPKILFIDEIELHLGKSYIDALSKILYRKCNYDGVSIIASSQNKEMFYNLISVNITVNQGRINKVRSFHSKSKKNKN